MKKRELVLFSTLAERVIYKHYRESILITCGICGNQTPEEMYMKNDCPHCQMGIDFEVESEGGNERARKLDKNEDEDDEDDEDE